MSGLSEGELRDLLDVDCDCGHGPDDHGSELFGCHLCPDYDEPRECPRSFLSLLAERLNGWADAREAAWRGEVDGLRARVEALADEWEGWRKIRTSPRIDAFSDAAERLREALEPASDAAGADLACDQRGSGSECHLTTEGRRTAHSDSESYAWPTNGSGK